MDACNPGINAKNLARLVRQETGTDLNLTRNQVCDAYKSIQDGKLPLPPMVLSKDGKYMLDRKSPLTGDDFEVLFSSSSKSDELKRLARKVGLSNYKEMTKAQLVDAIENVLKSKGVREPIRLHITVRKEKRISVNSNNNYQNNFNVNNRNGNGVKNNNNLKRISNESSNLGNGNRENGNRQNGNRQNGNRENENRQNGNRQNGNRENGNRQNGNRQNGNGASRTTRNKYYMNAMARRVRGEQPAPSRRSNDPAMTQLVNAFQKSKTSGPNSDALRRALERAKSTSSATNTRALAKQIEDAMKRGNTTTLNALRKKLAVPVMSEKDGKVAKLEKYVVNKGGKLNTLRRVAFMNEAQKSIKAYKNGTNMYNTAKTRITAAYETAYKANLNNMGPKNVIDKLQKNVNTIGNQKIKSSAREKLNAFKQSGGTDTSSKNAVIKLQKLDEELKLRKKDVNRDYLNEMRDEALKNINSYNIENGLAKIKTRVKEDMKKRGAEFNTMIANDMYKNVPSNVKTKLRNAYVSGNLNINGVKRGLNNALETSVGVFKGLENKIQNLQTKLNNSKLTANERNKLQANLKQATTNYKKLQNEKSERNREINVARKAVTALQGQRKELQNQKEKANAEIAELTKKLKNGSISNKEKEELAKARGNALAATEELQKLQEEKKSFNAEIAKAKQNVEAARAAQSAANINRNAKVAQAKKNAEASITKAQNTASVKIKEATNKVQNLQNQLTKRTNLTPKQVQNLRNQINTAKANAAQVKQNANNRVAAAQAAAQESMNALRRQANQEVANAKAEANAAAQAASKAEQNVLGLQNAAEKAEKKLVEQRAKVNELTQKLTNSENMSREQRAKLEQQLITGGRKVANAQKLAQNTKSNANAAVAKSRTLVAEAGRAANEASRKAQEAEQAKLTAEAEREKALDNKAEAIRLKAKANELRAKANIARNAAQAEAAESRRAASEANAKANEISEQLREANLNKAQMNALIREKNALLKKVQNEMQKQINVYKKQANKIVRNGATREAAQRNRIKALENNRNRWQADSNKKTNNLKLVTQQLAEKNNNLAEKIDEIKKTQSKVARLQKELNNTKTASAAEKNAIKTQLEAEKQNLARQFTQTQTDLKSTESELIKLTKNRNILFKELQNRSGTLLQTGAERNELQRQLEETRKILRNTQNNLGQLALAEQRARGQRENLRRRNAASQKVITGLTQQRQNAQRGINQLRATTRNLEQKRLAANRATNKTFNASAAFNRQMKSVAARQSWQSLKPKATMVGAVQADVLGKRLREKLLKNIDTTNISGKFVINGGPLPGSERRALKKEVQNPMTRLNKLRAIEKMIFNRKVARNSKATAEIAQKRMNQTIRLRGSAVNAQPPKFSFGNTPAQARVTRNQLLVQNNRNNAKKYINTFFKGIGLGTKGELKSRINKGENIGAVLRNARYRNSRAGGPAAAARIRGQAFAS
jgi:hypothetical protein